MKNILHGFLIVLGGLAFVISGAWLSSKFTERNERFCAREIKTGWSGGSPLEPINGYEVVNCPEEIF
ncbi:MAG: hypothetical protein AAB922_01430 [Patescibacteria group bacterium]